MQTATRIAIVSRFRMAILLALVAIAALPTSAHARRIPYCHLFSTAEVGVAIGYRAVTVKGQITSPTSLTNAPGTMTVCDFWSGSDRAAESSVITYKSGSTATKEFKATVKSRKTNKPKRVSGPWTSAYRISNNEVFVLKGKHIFHIQFQLKTTAAAVLGLAKTASRKL
jgi:hypothetical protein